MTFQIHALPMAPFQPLFDLSDQELKTKGACRVIADTNPGFPCRVSLQDAAPGETLILTNYRHLNGPTPYAASHAIYVRHSATQAQPKPDEVPTVLSSRLLSIRAFDANQMMQTADVVKGTTLAEALHRMFENPAITFIDIHNARQGCYAAKATRA